MKISKANQKLVDSINNVIHRYNLYVVTPNGNRRVINAHVAASGEVVVTDLYDETNYAIQGNRFMNG